MSTTTLQQQLMKEVFSEAQQKCATIFANAAAITETEGLSAALCSAAPGIMFSPVVTVLPHSITPRVQISHQRLSKVRAAIASAGLEIIEETVCTGRGWPTDGDVLIRLNGFDTPIHCTYLAAELAEAA